MIDSFIGPNRFLSNFYLSPLTFEGDVYGTVEHAYQAAKTLDPVVRAEIRNAPTPTEAKRRGRNLTLRADWEAIKHEVMLDLLRQKFRPGGLQVLLRATEDQELIEGNTWGDRHWGVCRGVGDNWLGQLLMLVREECQ